MDTGNTHPVPSVNGVPVATIIERVANGEYVPAIAKDIGVTGAAILHIVYRYSPDEYQQARLTRSEINLDQAIGEFDCADDQVMLARARERFRALAWRAEREHPDRWGARPTTAIGIAGSSALTVQIVSYAQQSPAIHDMSNARIQQSPTGALGPQGESMLTAQPSAGTGPMKRDSG